MDNTFLNEKSRKSLAGLALSSPDLVYVWNPGSRTRWPWARVNIALLRWIMKTCTGFSSLFPCPLPALTIPHCLWHQFAPRLWVKEGLRAQLAFECAGKCSRLFSFSSFFLIWWPSSVFPCNISYRQIWLYYSLGNLCMQMFGSNVWKYQVCVLSFCLRQIWWIFEWGKNRYFSEHSNVKYSETINRWWSIQDAWFSKLRL